MEKYTYTNYGHSFGAPGYYYRVDENLGRYEYDCTGFATHVLLESSLQAHDELKDTMGVGRGYCPTPDKWFCFFEVNFIAKR